MRTLLSFAALMALAACQQGIEPANDAVGETVAPFENAAPGADGRTGSVDTDRLHPEPANGRISRYSSLGKDHCKVVEESDEGPYWRMHCDGVGGYSVDYTDSDLRQNLTVFAANGTKTSLDLPSKVANGAFDRLGANIEWRGPAGGPPDALIVRVHVANDQGEDDGGQLAVARLAPKPCLVGVVSPGPGQNERAQALADKGGACL